MLDSLLRVRYNDKRKILVDFSGFGHLFATQLSCDSCVAFFAACISEVLAEWRTISLWKIIFCLLSRHAVVYGLINRNLSLPRLWTLYWKPVSLQHANKTILFGQFVEKRESMQTNNKMAVAPVGKLIWQMSIPPLISMFLQYSYNLIDSAFVARLSENALTAVSLSFPITTLMNATSI